jgi:hypothetical protein
MILIPITFFSRWGPIDDWGMLEYLLEDTSRMQLISSYAKCGRFYPLYRIEWDILSNISIDPYIFYFFNFVEALIACFILYHIYTKYSQKTIGFFIVTVLILSPAFVTSFYRLGVPDKNSFFLFIVGLLFIYKYAFSSSSPLKKNCYLFLSFLAVNLALYFKEPGFILISVFIAVFVLLNYAYNREWYIQNRKQILMIFTFSIASSFIFLVFYTALPHITEMNATLSNNYVTGFSPDSSLFEKSLLSIQSIVWFLFSDPLIIFVAPSILILRIVKWKGIMKNINDHRDRVRLFAADSALAATLCYACFYVVTAVINYHYLLPAYAFLIPALAIYAGILKNKRAINTQPYPGSINYSKLMIIVVSVLLIGSLVSGINQMILLKYIPYNMNEFMDNSVPIIKSDLDNRLPDDGINCFLLGVDRRQYVELYHSVPAFFKMRGIDVNRIDIKSVDKVDDNFQLDVSLEKYTAFRTKGIQVPENGDYIIIMPYSRRDEIIMIETLQELHYIELEKLYTTDNSYFIQLPFPIQIMRDIAKEVGLYKSDDIFYWTAGYSLYIVK